jgi:Protein of unknown function (DUF2786)
MSIVRKLRAKADSTAFPEEAETFRTKADEIERKLAPNEDIIPEIAALLKARGHRVSVRRSKQTRLHDQECEVSITYRMWDDGSALEIKIMIEAPSNW